jgi:AraC-like DNA-binding protein
MLLEPDAFARLCRAKELLTQQVSVRDVARKSHVSPFHFIRQFKALFGVTPHQYRIEARLDEAKRLLRLGRLSVTEVCMEVGMSSLGSFSTLFSQKVGYAPSEYHGRAPAPGCLSMMAYLPDEAFRNFREASAATPPLECQHANQTHQPDGQ